MENLTGGILPAHDLAGDHGLRPSRPRAETAVRRGRPGRRRPARRRRRRPPRPRPRQAPRRRRSPCLRRRRARSSTFASWPVRPCRACRSRPRPCSRPRRRAETGPAAPRSDRPERGRVTDFVRLLAVAIVGLALGLIASAAALDRLSPFDRVRLGAWSLEPHAGSMEADPYTLARIARSGEIPLANGEGLQLVARGDDDGRPLDARCVYRIGLLAPGRGRLDGEPHRSPRLSRRQPGRALRLPLLGAPRPAPATSPSPRGGGPAGKLAADRRARVRSPWSSRSTISRSAPRRGPSTPPTVPRVTGPAADEAAVRAPRPFRSLPWRRRFWRRSSTSS